MASISRILVTSSDFVLDKQQGRKGLTGLTENQVLEAKVLKLLSKGRAQLMIGGNKVIAKTHVPLKENETISLKVTKTGETQVLKLVEPKPFSGLPPGLGEMRSAGRAGPYARLLDLITGKVPLTETGVKPADAVITQAGQQKDIPVKDIPSLRALLQNLISGDNSVKQLPMLAKASPSDLSLLKSFVETKTIPWEQKALTLLVSGPETQPLVSGKILESVSGKLMAFIGSKQPQPMELPVPESAGTAGGEQIKMKQMVDVLTGGLGNDEKILVSEILKQTAIPFEVKLASLFMAPDKPRVPGVEMQKVEDALLKTILSMSRPAEVPAAPLQGGPAADATAIIKALRAFPVFRTLEQLIQTISIGPDQAPDTESLKTLISSSGLTWEKKLKALVDTLQTPAGRLAPDRGVDMLINQDIKALAMKLAEGFHGKEHQVMKSLKTFIDGLEKMQVLNTHTSEEAGRYLLPLPFFSGEELRFGQLFIDLDRNNENSRDASDRMVRVAFILEMSNLGHLKADFTIYKKSVSGVFGVENSGIKTFFDESLPQLKETLEQRDYRINKLETRVMATETLAVTTLADMVADTDSGVLNIVI